jgi:pyruvate dehydrogenase E1 component alpha subunit
MNEQDLINFEKDIKDNYSQAKIRGPVHLCGGNEIQLLQVFEKIKENDWVFSTHRSHYHALLKSKNPEWVKEQIFLKRSSHINSKKYKIFTSAIVGGICPIALGVALSIKKDWDNNIRTINLNAELTKEEKKKGAIGRCMGMNHVWCFVGDMAAEMGIFHECLKYARGEDLPITFVIEDNGMGCDTPTNEVWKAKEWFGNDLRNLDGYQYKRIYPHYGICDENGKRIWVDF